MGSSESSVPRWTRGCVSAGRTGLTDFSQSACTTCFLRDPNSFAADMPPSTASEVSSFFDNILSLLGVITISQPSDISAQGMTRTIDFLRHKGIPIIGLVSMMDGYLCPSCGLVTHQLLSPKLAMEKIAKDCGIPFLLSIPQAPAVGLLKPYFDRLAKTVLKRRPITLRKQTLLQIVQETAGELVV